MNKAEFLTMVSKVMSPSDVDLVETAYLLAKKFHKGQFRKELDSEGNPLRYFEHVRRTALILLQEGFTSKELIITALLHDAIEDAAETRLLSRLIESYFGENVGLWIRLLSKTNKHSYIETLREGLGLNDSRFMIVKAADRLDNLRSLPSEPEFREKQLRETREVYLPLFAEFSRNKHSGILGFERIVKNIKDLVA